MKIYFKYCDTKNEEALTALKQTIKNTQLFKLSKKKFVKYIIEGEGLLKEKSQIDFLLKLKKEAFQNEYKNV